MIASASAAAGLLKNCATVLGCELPSAFTEAIERAEHLVEQVDAIGDGSPHRLHRAVISALEHGTHPSTDKDVRGALISLQLMTSGCAAALRVHRDTLVEDAIREHADTVLSGWADRLDPALEQLTLAAEAMAGVEDPASMDAGSVHPGLAELWTAATDALRSTAVASRGVNTIAAASRVTLTSEQLVLVFSLPSINAYDQVRSTGMHANPWNICQAGGVLDFVDSLTELRDRIAGLAEQRQAALTPATPPRRPSYI